MKLNLTLLSAFYLKFQSFSQHIELVVYAWGIALNRKHFSWSIHKIRWSESVGKSPKYTHGDVILGLYYKSTQPHFFAGNFLKFFENLFLKNSSVSVFLGTFSNELNPKISPREKDITTPLVECFQKAILLSVLCYQCCGVC